MPKDVIFEKSAPPKVTQMPVDMPESGFRVILYFNRFGIEDTPSGDDFLVHFGFVSTAGDVLAAYSALLGRTFLLANRSEWETYLGQVGSVPDRALDVSWRPPASRVGGIEIVNAIRIGKSGSDAELRLYCVSMIGVIDRSREHTRDKPLSAQPLALLQTSLEQQQLLLLSLLKRLAQ